MMIIWILVIAFIDQWTKQLAVKYLKHQGRKNGRYFYWSYVENRGAAMGLLKRWPIILKTLSLCIVIGLCYVLIAYDMPWIRQMSIATILGGGLGNVWDRFVRGYVVDFFSPKIKKLPYFNIADVFVIIGCLSLLMTELYV